MHILICRWCVFHNLKMEFSNVSSVALLSEWIRQHFYYSLRFVTEYLQFDLKKACLSQRNDEMDTCFFYAYHMQSVFNNLVHFSLIQQFSIVVFRLRLVNWTNAWELHHKIKCNSKQFYCCNWKGPGKKMLSTWTNYHNDCNISNGSTYFQWIISGY